MKKHINGIELYYEIESSNPSARWLILLHGGPGIDHNYFKPEMSQLSDDFRVVYLDHRGHGKSDRSDPSKWNLEQWCDDLQYFISALGIEKAVILGNSFGGFVAQLFAIKYPQHVDQLILSSTMGTVNTQRIVEGFKGLYGEDPARVAKKFWDDPASPYLREEYRRVCGPLYNTQHQNNKGRPPIIKNDDVLIHFYGQGGEGRSFNFLPRLKNIFAPTLILAGKQDPVSTIKDADDMMEALPRGIASIKLFDNCGHGVQRDNPPLALSTIRAFCKIS